MINRLQGARIETIEAGHLPKLGDLARVAAILNALLESAHEVP